MREASQARRQLGRGHVGHTHKVGGVGEFAHLFGGNLGQLLVAIADIDIPQSGHTVENAAAIGGVQIDPVSALNHKWVLVLAGVEDGMELALILFEEGGGAIVLLRHGLIPFLRGACRAAGQGLLLLRACALLLRACAWSAMNSE